MKQFLFLTIVSIFLTGEVYGQGSTYASLADNFNQKAKLTNEKGSIDWSQELRTVFTLYSNIPETVFETLSPTATSTFWKPVEAGLNKFPYDEAVIVANANLGVILANQPKVNDLFEKISKELQKKATPKESYGGTAFSKFFNSKLESSRLKTISSSLYKMRTIQQKFETVFIGELSLLGQEKEDQEAKLEALLAAASNAESVKYIDDAIASFKKAQKIVWDRLITITNVMSNYYGERIKWADFLIGIRKTLDSPLQLDKQFGMWESGLKALKKSPAKLKKMISRK